MTFRAFISADLEAPPALHDLARELRGTGAPLKLVDLGILHLTMKFLGDTPEKMVEGIVAGMTSAVAGEGTIAIRLRGAGALPNLTRMNVVYVGVEEGGRLVRIAQRLDAELARRGFPPEGRPWLSHATVARVKGRGGEEALRRVITAHTASDFGTQEIASIRLKRSVLGREGPSYGDVAVIPLAPDHPGPSV